LSNNEAGGRFVRRRLAPVALAAASVALALASAVAAQSGSAGVNWWVLASGGGSASGGQAVLRDVIGQPIVGPSAGGSVVLNAGYLWGNTALQQMRVYLPLIKR
jgi:hypothetical protein